MAGNRQSAQDGKAVARAIRNGIGTELNRRSLSRLPQFRADGDLPEEITRLLERLDGCERVSKVGRGSAAA